MKEADYRTIHGLCVCEYICNKWKYSKIKWFGWQVQWYWFGFCIFIPNHLQQTSTDFAIRKNTYILKKKKASLEQFNLSWEPSSVRVHLLALPRGHHRSLIWHMEQLEHQSQCLSLLRAESPQGTRDSWHTRIHAAYADASTTVMQSNQLAPRVYTRLLIGNMWFPGENSHFSKTRMK